MPEEASASKVSRRRILTSPILLHRSKRCDAMAQQNRLFRQKFLQAYGTPMLQIYLWNNSSSKVYARIRGTAGEKSVAPCVTPVWNRQSRQQVVSRR